VATIIRPIDDGIALEDVRNRLVFAELRTIRPPRQNSSLVDFALALGATPTEIFAKGEVEIVLERLRTEPELVIATQWEAWSKQRREVVRVGMKNFPDLGSGRYNHILQYRGEEIVARAAVTKYERVPKTKDKS
jgi:hypothetical protein